MTVATVDTSLWLRSYHGAHAAPARLLCLPHAGGSASYYFPVSRALSPRIEVLAVQYPGRQDRRGERGLGSLQELAADVYQQLRHADARPTALFGHSMGASVAFEVARLMEADGVAPAHLYVSGRRAPSAHRDERIHLRGDADLIAEIRRLDGTAGGLLDDPDVLRMFLGVIRDDYRAAETYRWQPGPPLRCPVTVLVGDRDPKVDLDEAATWQTHTTGPFAMQVFDGGHFYLHSHQAAVLDTIRSGLTPSPRR
ncbi:thioesterase [Paractinoplanes abujensis]|uniref:Surfactin synthase thioesterase subunit n=1 Tax=Paractinoplanes abujensis TaxID=882441 RepID=A0A7W7CQU7_9ACTN|nr:alpha/beta fold hydrolase [Actinoplanes abujensis]MBB4693032.1 surfactin synthase thioesterase subunit [Actinoplanes abujensis]GID24984.1 thioesterase [Actinoplanes abujensis]